MWVLMFVFLNGYGPRPDVRFQEFTTKERCEAAALILQTSWRRSGDEKLINKWECVPK